MTNVNEILQTIYDQLIVSADRAYHNSNKPEWKQTSSQWEAKSEGFEESADFIARTCLLHNIPIEKTKTNREKEIEIARQDDKVDSANENQYVEEVYQ